MNVEITIKIPEKWQQLLRMTDLRKFPVSPARNSDEYDAEQAYRDDRRHVSVESGLDAVVVDILLQSNDRRYNMSVWVEDDESGDHYENLLHIPQDVLYFNLGGRECLVKFEVVRDEKADSKDVQAFRLWPDE